MTDVHDQATRSFNMSRIRSVNTGPEMIVRRFLFSKGFRYKLHSKALPARPDIFLPKYQTVVLVHGCFWHGHQGCPLFVVPKTRTDWWLSKIESNRVRDRRIEKELSDRNLKVLTIFECQLRPKERENTLTALLQSLNSVIT